MAREARGPIKSGPGNPKGTAALQLGSEVGMDRLGELFDDLLTLKMVQHHHTSMLTDLAARAGPRSVPIATRRGSNVLAAGHTEIRHSGPPSEGSSPCPQQLTQLAADVRMAETGGLDQAGYIHRSLLEMAEQLQPGRLTQQPEELTELLQQLGSGHGLNPTMTVHALCRSCRPCLH